MNTSKVTSHGKPFARHANMSSFLYVHFKHWGKSCVLLTVEKCSTFISI